MFISLMLKVACPIYQINQIDPNLDVYLIKRDHKIFWIYVGYCGWFFRKLKIRFIHEFMTWVVVHFLRLIVKQTCD